MLTFDEWFWKRFVMHDNYFNDIIAREVARAAWDAAIELTMPKVDRLLVKIDNLHCDELVGTISPKEAWHSAVWECQEIIRKERGQLETGV